MQPTFDTHPDAEGNAVVRLVESRTFGVLVAVAVIANAIVLGVDVHGDLDPRVHMVCDVLDTVFLSFFVLELGLKLVAWRGKFFTNAWNWFDAIVVAIALIPASGPFAVLRTLRVLRMLRLVSVIPAFRRVVEALIRAIPGIGAILGVLAVFFYIGGVLSTALFGADHAELFGTLRLSATTLFQLMLFDDWATVVREVEVTDPGASLFFVGFTVITGFAVLNLFIAVMVDALREEHDRLQDEDLNEIEARQKRAVDDISEIEDIVRRMEKQLDRIEKRQVDGRDHAPQ